MYSNIILVVVKRTGLEVVTTRTRDEIFYPLSIHHGNQEFAPIV